MGRLNTSLNRVIVFDKICRACMMEKVGLGPIFNLNIADNLMSIAAVKIKQNDELPSKICSDCLKKLQYSIVFKQKVEKADSVLRKYHSLQKKKAESENDVEENQELDQVGSNSKTELKNISFTNTDHEYTQRVRQSSRLAKKANFKLKTSKGKSKILHELIQFDKENSEDEKEQPSLKITAVNIFSDGPPPLVPLVPIAPEEIPTFPVEKKTPLVAIALKPISDETPPLVPLKPIIPGLEELAIITKDIVKPKFSCQICYEEFSDPLKLKGHMSIHSQENRLTCNICKKEFNDSKRLIGHLKGHMVVKRYECKFCGKRYPNPSTFKVHMRSHTGERPYKCPTCGKGFVRWAAVAVHMKCHESNTPYRCELCERGFKLASNLERHKVIHTGSMPYICSYCGKTFTQNDNLQLHVRTYHTFERPYLCSKCGKGFVSATRLNRHMWTHSGKKQYTCRTCNKGYANLNDLRNHMKIHGMQGDDSKRYACEVCDLRFYHKCRLARHIKVHERPHICAVCNKTFSREELLVKHMTLKHGVGEGDVQQEPVIDIDIVEHVKIESSDGLVFQRY